jgi:hypothetical protein
LARLAAVLGCVAFAAWGDRFADDFDADSAALEDERFGMTLRNDTTELPQRQQFLTILSPQSRKLKRSSRYKGDET